MYILVWKSRSGPFQLDYHKTILQLQGHHMCTMLEQASPRSPQHLGKAKAFDKLAAFYDACAQVEIDEYRDYDKAERIPSWGEILSTCQT